MGTRVSVITPCLNSAKTIRDTIESVLYQTYQDIEYIIVDGVSTDGTLDIIKKYETRFMGRLRYISEKDKGIYDAMNKGIACTTGEVVGIINSDDWYEPDAVEQIVNGFENTDAGVVYGEEWILNERREREYHTYQMGFPPHPGMFVRRSVYQKYGVYDLKYRIASDWDLILRFMTSGVKFHRMERIVANYSKTGISSVRSLECAEETHKIELKYLGRGAEDLLKSEDIEEKYNRVRLVYISQKKPKAIREVLEQECDLSKGMVIFGAGTCGREFEEVLRNCKIPISFFADNDERKWRLELNGIKIYSPEILRHYRGYVLITNTKFQADICRQLQGYSNAMLKWGTLEEMRKKVIKVCKDLFFDE